MRRHAACNNHDRGRTMNCLYERKGDGSKKDHLYVCASCGHIRESNYGIDGLHRRCDNSPKDIPAITARLLRFSLAAIVHASKGNPTCTQEQIDERLGICTVCDDFTGSACKHCGCNCRKRKQYLNKLAWADQCCPINKWEAYA